MDERLPSGTFSEHGEITEQPEGPPTFVNFIRQLAERPEPEREDIFRDLRRRRHMNSYDRGEDSLFIDDAIVELFEQGDTELASRLINPSYSESASLQRAVVRHYEDDEKASAALSSINEVIVQKVKVFSERFRTHLAELDSGVVDMLVAELKTGVADPESALEVPPAFWSNFLTLPDEAQAAVLSTSGSLENAAEAIKELERGGLLGYSREFMPPAAALQSVERAEYVASASEALHTFKTNYPNLPLGRTEIALLASHREPHAALALAIRSFPGMQPSIAISFLNSELNMLDPYTDNPPSTIPEETARILPDLNEAFRQAGISSYEVPLLAREALELGPEAFRAVFPNFIKSMTMESGLREQLDVSLGLHVSVNSRTIDTIRSAHLELTDIFSSKEKLSSEEMMQRLDRFAMKQYAAKKEYELTEAFLTRIRNNERDGTVQEPDTSPPSSMMRMERRGLDKCFDSLGIPKKMQTDLFEAWMSYSPVGFAYAEYKKENVKDLTDGEIERVSLVTTKVFYEQLTAVQHYCEQYGTTELIELNDIFGIVNFTRGTAEQFHSQLLRWKDTEEAVRNINVAAAEDHNFSFGETADGLFFASFGEEGSFYFEASTIAELSRAFVQVGTRERAAGREPSEQSEVQNVIISGHGEPRAIELSWGNLINIENFATAAHARHQFAEKGGKVRANDYSQYIGNAYRIILHACSAGKEIPESINISQVLHTEYGVPVEASPRDSSGYRVNERGRVGYGMMDKNDDFVYVEGVRHE